MTLKRPALLQGSRYKSSDLAHIELPAGLLGRYRRNPTPPRELASHWRELEKPCLFGAGLTLPDMWNGKDRPVIAGHNQVTIDHRFSVPNILITIGSGLTSVPNDKNHTTYRQYYASVGAHPRSFTTHFATTSSSTFASGAVAR